MEMDCLHNGFSSTNGQCKGALPNETKPDDDSEEAQAVKGRNTWLLWTGGNHGFWDYLARHGYGWVDFLKIIDNRHVDRKDRFAKLGLINEPGMQKPHESTDEYGLWFDKPKGWDRGNWPPANPDDYLATYPEAPNPDVYGYSSGVMGLRLYPNPEFFEGKKAKKAQADWNVEKYFSDPNYAKGPDLIRPYRVGMSCAFCHIAYNPINPPKHPSEPAWSNLLSTIGNQYFKFGKFVGFEQNETDVLWHLVNYPKAGTVDTSLVATDGINNPGVPNSIFNLQARFDISKKTKREEISKNSAQIPILPEYGLPELPPRHVMKILFDGSDSIGALGALSRVYVNIGTFHEEWLQDINVLVGVQNQRVFTIKKAQDNSIYWQSTQDRAENLAKYFLHQSVTAPRKLKEAPGGEDYLLDPDDECGDVDKDAKKTQLVASENSDNCDRLEKGKEHFATHCIVCHSSKQPEVLSADPENLCKKPEKEQHFWCEPSNWKKWIDDDFYKKWAQEEVKDPLFLNGNYLSTDQRYKVTDIGINIARFSADNPLKGKVWQEFSSEDYKALPLIDGAVELQHPYKRHETNRWNFSEDVGMGRARPLTLVNIWATALFLHNNSVGEYPAEHDPSNAQDPLEADVSVAGRMKVFNDSIHKLLGIEERKGFDSIVRTTIDTRIEFPRVVLLQLVEQQFGRIWKFVLIGALTLALMIGIFYLFLFLKRISGDKKTLTCSFSGLAAALGLFVLGTYFAGDETHRLAVLLVVLTGTLILGGSLLFLRAIRLLKRVPVCNFFALVFGLVLVVIPPYLATREAYQLGHIPKGTPVSLLANVNSPGWYEDNEERQGLIWDVLKVAFGWYADNEEHQRLIRDIGKDLLKVTLFKLPSLAHDDVPDLVPNLLKLNKVPDFVIDRGHTFGYERVDDATGNEIMRVLSEQERLDLIEFLKTM